MVLFSNAGRMGNFLFQAATSLAYALKHDLDFTVPTYTDNPKWNPIYLQHLAHPNYNPDKQKIEIFETQHNYQELPFNESWRDCNIVFNGYWQTEKYFVKYRREILSLFEFPYEMKEGYVSIHVRRGDYVELRNKHPEVTLEWYEKAMSLFPNYKFLVFSDDIEWCRKTFSHRNDVEYAIGGDEVSDLIQMSCCEHNICSPSTFSWWGMWLNKNPNKKVIFPSWWFSEGWCNLNTDDIVPNWCVKLNI